LMVTQQPLGGKAQFGGQRFGGMGVWGLEASGDNSVVKEHIRKIRQKLQGIAGQGYIETVWGVGYRWKQ